MPSNSHRPSNALSNGNNAEESWNTLLAALAEPRAYPHASGAIAVLQTHISAVFLAGDFAYKVKKPVKLPFLDFTSLQARRHFCGEELRLNRRTAPQLYLDVVAITGTPDAPRVGGTGLPIEYAVRMRRFRQEDLLDRALAEGRITPEAIDELALALARFHASLEPAAAGSGFGSRNTIAAQTRANFSEMQAIGPGADADAPFRRLRAWSEGELERLAAAFERRQASGCVRECHGDLHLGNIAFMEGRPTPFDCIEFDPELRWNDVMSEVAFLAMDLLHRERRDLAFRFLDAYLGATGDYDGLGVLRHYLVYRALVRSKVALIRCAQRAGEPEADCPAYLRLALAIALDARPALVLMHGLSGSGKSVLASQLLGPLGAIRLRSDLERKRLAGMAPAERSGSPVLGGLYTAGMSGHTYARLRAIAEEHLLDGWPILVDATFLKRAERSAFGKLAERLGVPFAIVSCTAQESTLCERIQKRSAHGADPSEATLEVLVHQMRAQEPFADHEERYVLHADSEHPGSLASVAEQLLDRIDPRASTRRTTGTCA